jgi:hypothetical protein
MKEQFGLNWPLGEKILRGSPPAGSKIFPTIFADFGGWRRPLPKQ